MLPKFFGDVRSAVVTNAVTLETLVQQWARQVAKDYNELRTKVQEGTDPELQAKVDEHNKQIDQVIEALRNLRVTPDTKGNSLTKDAVTQAQEVILKYLLKRRLF